MKVNKLLMKSCLKNKEKELQKEQQDRFIVKKGEITFLTIEEVKTRIKHKYKTYEETKND